MLVFGVGFLLVETFKYMLFGVNKTAEQVGSVLIAILLVYGAYEFVVWARENPPIDEEEDLTEAETYQFFSEGEFWRVTWDGKSVMLKEMDGFHYIHMLLSSPRQPISVLTVADTKLSGDEIDEKMRSFAEAEIIGDKTNSSQSEVIASP